MSNFTPTLTVVNNHPVVSSTKIAEHFGKRHDDVLKSIRAVMADCPDEFNARNFADVEYSDAKGEKRPSYDLTRDAFSLVCFGYTGKKAIAWKIRYIEAFNAMEAELLGKAALPPVQDIEALIDAAVTKRLAALPAPELKSSSELDPEIESLVSQVQSLANATHRAGEPLYARIEKDLRGISVHSGTFSHLARLHDDLAFCESHILSCMKRLAVVAQHTRIELRDGVRR
jgi:Rha family phage regulatory protein